MDSYRPVIWFIILISFHVGHTLRCACRKDLQICTSIHDMQADFKTAQKICMENGGKLLNSSNKTISSLLFNKTGDFWVGTEGDCLSSSRTEERQTLDRGKKDVACSSRCMLVSRNGKLTARLCEEQANGFLCDGIQWENCWQERASEVQILNNKDCALAPCEHRCNNVPGGHMCSCFSKSRPGRTVWERCEHYCDMATCPQPCATCECPDGFIKDNTQCTDLDECSSNHNNCEQKCRNTFGSYKCSCQEGFMLVNKSKCVPLITPTPLIPPLVTTRVNKTLSVAAVVTPAEYIGLTLFFILLALSALIGLLYYLRKCKSDGLEKDSTVPDNTTVQEAQLQV